MRKLTVVLRHGFENDHARVLVAGELAYERTGIRTRTQIDRADAFELELREDQRSLEIQVNTRGRQASRQVDLATTRAIAIDIGMEGGIEIHPLAEEARDA